jgi:hypothetical protein
MTENVYRDAVALVDAEPSAEFLSTLRAQLLAELSATVIESATSATTPQTEEEEVVEVIEETPSRRQRRTRRVWLAAATCLAVLGTGAIVLFRADDSPESADQLADVNPEEVGGLGEQAAIPESALGPAWEAASDQGGVPFAQLDAQITAAMPQCAELSDYGIWLPTTKSVTTHEFFSVPLQDFMYHDVMVFASEEDASRAMDKIAEPLFQSCVIARFDLLAPFWPTPETTSISTPATVPEIDSHGDRQIVFGQRVDYRFSGEPGPAVLVANVYVQVGRAIAWISPQYYSFGSEGLNARIKLSSDALERVFGTS